ncbi:hypothetical protein ACVBEQ_27015 [Nakamurella sp. GG22]
MALVLGVHGILQEQRGRHQLLHEWQVGLADGVDAAAGSSAASPSLDMYFYGRQFLPTSAQGVRQAPYKGRHIADVLTTPVDDDDRAFLEDAAVEVEAAPAFVDRRPAMGAPRVPSALQALAQRLSRRLDGGLVLEFLSVLRQVKTYLSDDAMAEKIRAGFLAHLNDARPRVVIAHSLGSVVAVDALRFSSDSTVPMLITVGSPLGMRAVQSRLRGPAGAADAAVAPANVSRWLNVYDPGDPIAAAGGLSRIWPMVEDYTVGNGKNPHGILGYLGKQVVGRAVLNGVAD